MSCLLPPSAVTQNKIEENDSVLKADRFHYLNANIQWQTPLAHRLTIFTCVAVLLPNSGRGNVIIINVFFYKPLLLYEPSMTPSSSPHFLNTSPPLSVIISSLLSLPLPTPLSFPLCYLLFNLSLCRAHTRAHTTSPSFLLNGCSDPITLRGRGRRWGRGRRRKEEKKGGRLAFRAAFNGMINERFLRGGVIPAPDQ